MNIDKDRLFSRLIELGKIGGQDNGGVTRLSFSKEESEAKCLVASYMRQAGLSVREDPVGNLIGRKEGKQPAAPVILTGSHLDTVPDGGAFDGVLGVIAGIEALQSMDESGIETIHPVEVICFTDEEGSRFGYGMLGSRGITGSLEPAKFQLADRQGVTLAQAMEKAGFSVEKAGSAARKRGSVKAYIELHIEQGKVLESQDLPVGIVSGIAGPLWLKFSLAGEAGHAGATPMQMRRDPLVAASKIIGYIDSEVTRYPGAVATVGKISVSPGGINIIPGRSEFTLDLRYIHEKVRNELENSIRTYARHVCSNSSIDLDISDLQRIAPCPCSREIMDIIEESCTAIGIRPFSLVSGAGHDGMQFKDFCPVGMIFVRSKNGSSHRPDEWSSKEDCGTGAEVLYKTILKLDEQEEVT